MWAQGSGSRRPHTNSGMKPLRAFRSHPYPPREEISDPYHELESYGSLAEQDDYSDTMGYKTYEDSGDQPHLPYQPSVAAPSRDDKRSALYRRLYEKFHGDDAKQPADCVVLSVNNQNLDYPKSLGHCLQERGLSVEMLYLQAESGLTRALQDVRSDGSHLCILVEQTNVTLSSCTVIIFSESLKIHRNMPKDQAVDLVIAEFGSRSGGRRQLDVVEAETKATEMTDDYVERAKLEHHFVPSTMGHLLFFMAEGLYLYPEELGTIAEYIQSRQDHLQSEQTLTSKADTNVAPETLSLSSSLGKPPPLLPHSEHSAPSSSMGESSQGHLMGTADSYLKTNPPPLFPVDAFQGSSHRSSALHGPLASHSLGAPHVPADPPGTHSPPAGPGAPYGPSTTFGSQTTRGPPGQRGPPGLRSLLGPRESPASQAHQGPSRPRGSPSTHGPIDHEPHDFHSSRGPQPLLRGPLSKNGPRGLHGPQPSRGPRAPPPALRSIRMGNPTGPAPHSRRLLP